ncbi:MAG TPA: UDP-glucose 4-epimerase GalE [Fimbriimonadales bacterium]|nr:UDP-glucose 4-epimerase GalE [Fimbriimonadales bacterium]
MILVLGGAGFVGSHVAKALRQKNLPHLVADNLEKGHLEAIGKSPFEKTDIRNPAELDALFSRFSFESVMLFAGYTSVPESVQFPDLYFSNNFIGAFNLLDSMRKHDVKRIIFSSSAAVYGEPRSIPIPEDHPTNPTNPYGETKLAVERLLHWESVAYGLKAISLRYFNAAGADPEGEIGEDHRPETHLIPLAIDAALGRCDALTIFGDDYDTPDGTCIRDYIHVSDLADAHLLALEKLSQTENPCHKAINLGSEHGFSVKDVVDTVERVSGRKVPYKIGPRRPGDPARLVASSRLAKSFLGWKPRYDDLETIVEHAFSWRSCHPNGYEKRLNSG